ncbi:MAG: FGGY family carbohydrate kinase [Bacteroidota bacterium]|nr:carbohydrate kinase [Flavisolibacter sp.]MDQ3842607.1 FGGY family carbohydrate kinase [Bacteroidota bacterium]MBD0295924.1 carbohydrate kinase [Flavisolibacter sp.]MBD0349580.1 carbohydrate kinase [Flavisolibacter sp.]MBD0364520.1 carbohydrate kinase [Flavisolibacter sp.]
MSSIPVIAVYDVGKTNKKLFLFDQQYNIVYERSARLPETVDEDGDPCEDVEALRWSIFDLLKDVFRHKQFELKAINFSTYGASFVHLDTEGHPVAPLYNYLKEYPEYLKQKFYNTYGGETQFSFQTASPVLGSLNSGMQLYRLKYEKPHLYRRIKYALHLPQYMSFLLSDNVCSDITSIGCHTNLWDFQKNDYHEWVYKEGVIEKLAPITPSDSVVPPSFPGNHYCVGIGLHDSSAALIPYLVAFDEPFILLSTGTWCITLNPFNQSPLTVEELEKDCLCYLSYEGKPVKASRLFAGYERDLQVKRLAEHFNKGVDYYQTVAYNPETVQRFMRHDDLSALHEGTDFKGGTMPSAFGTRDLDDFSTYEEAYHQLIWDLVVQQKKSSELVMKGANVKQLFVDGGFSKNPIYMNLLPAIFPELKVYAASIAQATALGAALAIHDKWNTQPLKKEIIELKPYHQTLTLQS